MIFRIKECQNGAPTYGGFIKKTSATLTAHWFPVELSAFHECPINNSNL